MSVLSIDVGIKNLAICLLSSTNEILLWEVLNVSSLEPSSSSSSSNQKHQVSGGGGGVSEAEAGVPPVTESSPLSVVSTPTKCSLCKHNAKYRKTETLFCLRHAKESAYLLPTKDLLPAKLSKLKLPQLMEVVQTYSMDTTSLEKTKKRKADYLDTITSTLLDPLPDTNPNPRVKAADISLVDIARIMTTKLDLLLQNHPEVGTVIIENQISPIATRMTSIQGMLTQYFIMKNATQPIQYISAKNKLKDFDVDKECYADRKKSGIEICKTQLLASNPRWNDFFLQHKKKDDLADCYLQGLWFTSHRQPK